MEEELLTGWLERTLIGSVVGVVLYAVILRVLGYVTGLSGYSIDGGSIVVAAAVIVGAAVIAGSGLREQ